ncbi:TetR family transcriptional regulator [uncultured Jatrophihabitans sp.]|uniref:TetR family transcriptional regulator n=1 Tax=uncultured Jatrophihabitans sp. TaxID=1610747 RepID=UPI0035CC2B6F
MTRPGAPAGSTRTGRPVTADPRDADSLSPVQRARRDAIVRQALRLLERAEFDSIQMRDVALRSGVALGTVYRYFASKDHLFGAVLVEWGRSFERHLAADPLHGATSVERLRDLVSRVIDAFDRRPQVLRLISTLDTSPDERGRQLYLEFAAMTHHIVEKPVSEFDGQRAGAVGRTLLLVLGGAFRAWGTGSLTAAEVRRGVDEAIDLIYPPGSPYVAPRPGAGTRKARAR